MASIFDPTDPTADVEAYLVGGKLVEDFGALLGAFMEERVLPIAKELAAMGQDPQELLLAFARIVHVAAKAIEDKAGAPTQ